MEGAAEGTTEGAAEAFPVVLEAIPYRKDDVCLIDDAVRFGYMSDDLVPAAYDLEVLIVDVLYVAGPLIASVLLAICDAGATLGVVYALMAVGCAMLAACAPARSYATQVRSLRRTEESRSESSLLPHINIVLLLLICASTSAFSGWIETAVPLYYSQIDMASLSGTHEKGLRPMWNTSPLVQIVTPACAGLGSLVDDLLEQVGAGLGECELAEARIDGSEVGVDDLVESVVLHDVSFRSAWRRSCFLFFPLAAAVSLLLFGYVQRGWRCRFPACGVRLRFSLRFLPHRVSLFCCAFIIGRLNRRCHATIVDSFVFSSANLEINVTML